MCQAGILYWWPTNKQQALYANSLLNFGNNIFPKAGSSVQVTLASTAQAPQQASDFWDVTPDISSLLAFSYPQSALPAGFQRGVQPRRRSETVKRLQPDSNFGPQQPHKRSKAGSGKLRGDRPVGKRQLQVAELSNKMQQRLAIFLELVSRPAAVDAPDVKLVRLLAVAAP